MPVFTGGIQMRILTKAAFSILVLLLLLGCSKEGLYRGLYEGATTHEKLQNTPDPLHEPVSYEQYERERNENRESDE